ncbi:MAG: LLM class flavin-dependent oxidoreductase [Candidatus Tectomicrobia bacterium]|uniref:LLM class flavin-dependent oxidoreductase n=1 Tax=Tectimicrobiota bacterium TaxID=2528274 RepID=A0A932GMW1_UNCTE|nr:LLM class flavin-dependent oxidoreductase [Candidatus Tectomicrobia bacterium]
MAGKKTDFGILLPTRGLLLASQDTQENPDPNLIFDMAKQIEAYGYQSIWVGDSLLARPRLDALVTLAAVGAVAPKPKLGTCVFLPAMRHPLLLAQTTATVDFLSNGRLILGIGIGSRVADYYFEWVALGIPPEKRTRRMVHVVEALKKLWTGEPVTTESEFFPFQDARILPTPIQKPGVPIWFATGHGRFIPAQYARLVRLGEGAMMNLDMPWEFKQHVENIEKECDKQGRDPATIHRCMYLSVTLGNDAQKATEEGEGFLTKYYLRNWWEGRWGPFGPPQVIIDRINAFQEAGAQSFVIRFCSYDQMAQLEWFTKEVWPHCQ